MTEGDWRLVRQRLTDTELHMPRYPQGPWRPTFWGSSHQPGDSEVAQPIRALLAAVPNDRHRAIQDAIERHVRAMAAAGAVSPEWHVDADLSPDAHTVTAADYDDPDSMINRIDRVLDDYEGERS